MMAQVTLGQSGALTSLALETPDDPSIPTAAAMCVHQMHVSCGEVLEAFHDTGDMVGAVGIPRR